MYSFFMGQPGRIDHVFEISDGFGICVGNGPALIFHSLAYHFRWKELLMPDLMGLHLGNFPVLAVEAAEVAARGGDGEYFALRLEMKKRLFFNGIDMHGARVAVGEGIQGAVMVNLGAAYASVARGQHAAVGTDATGNRVVFKLAV